MGSGRGAKPFGLPPAFGPAFFVAAQDAGQKPGGKPEGLTPHKAILPLAWLAFAALAQAQNAPHLAYVYPAGGQRGTTVAVKVGGQFLTAVTGAYVAGHGVQAAAADYARPMNGQQATELREKMQELQKLPASPDTQKQLSEVRLKLATFNRNMNPVLGETETLQVTIARNAEPGLRELRLSTAQGLSNPILFAVGQLPESSEKQSEFRTLLAGMTLQDAGIESELSVTIPVTINGRIMPRPARQQTAQFTPGEADRYRFHARRGQNLIMTVSARELMPYLADAVPGWFQPTIALFDDKGTELAYDDDYRFNPDPVLHYQIPADGDYILEIKDALYRGREDFVYRMSIGELPFVTSEFPLGGRAGTVTNVALGGWNLPSNRVAMNGKGKPPGIYTLPAAANRLPFAIDMLPEVTEKEPNDAVKNAQRIKLPVTVNGRIDRPGDWDVFSIQGRAGQEIVAEVLARRLGSPLDSVLKLTDAKGSQLAFNDDFDDLGAGLLTHQADSYLRATLPATGTYYISIGDAQRKGGPEYAYRLRIGPPRPDFKLLVTPSAINGGRGMSIPITVHALRRDGFSGEIAVALKDAPPGLTLSGAVVPAGQDRVRMTVTIPPAAPLADPVSLKLEGRATIEGHEVTHAAQPADEMTQAFAYHHLVPADDLKLAITRRAVFRSPIRMPGSQTLRIPVGGSVRIPVQVLLPPNSAIIKLDFELSEPPDGLGMRPQPAGGSGELVLQCDAAKAKPGLKGNLIVNLVGERTVTPAKGGASPTIQRVQLGALPAMPFEIVAR